MATLSVLLDICEGIHHTNDQWYGRLVFLQGKPDRMVEQTVEMSIIWDPMTSSDVTAMERLYESMTNILYVIHAKETQHTPMHYLHLW